MFARFVLSAAVAVASVVAGGAGQTATFGPELDAFSLLRQFNLITRGDVSGPVFHADGRALIGGKLSASNAQVNGHGADGFAPSDFDELILLDATGGAQVKVDGGGTASYDGTLSSNQIQNAARTTSPALVPGNYLKVLDTFAAELAGLAATATAEADDANRLKLTGTSSGLAVYDLTALDLGKGFFEITAGGADLVVANVRGSGTLTIGANFQGGIGKSVSSKVIWNFLGFDRIELTGNEIWGQILAGGATVGNDALIEGSLYAGSLVARDEIHAQLLAYDPSRDLISGVPLPGTLPLLVCALGGAVFLRRRPSQAKA